MTQNEAILDYIKRHGSITPMEAMTHLGIMRLASRISELKQLGVDVRDKMIYRRNENGVMKKWKEYWVA